MYDRKAFIKTLDAVNNMYEDTESDEANLIHSKTNKTIMTSVGKSKKNFDAIAQEVKKSHGK
tara:strand:- start:19868 stop:20053 length:186 start_codon:yes stop_codon:yes gene_type:complete